MTLNPTLLIDGYKLDHRRQYPPKTEYVYSNWTPRKSRVPGQDEVVFFGLQYFLIKYLINDFNEHFFYQARKNVTEKYTRLVNSYLGPNTIGQSHIEALHDLGYIPLRFRALREGTRVPIGVPMFTVENTHPEFFWLVNYIETLLSCVLWLPCTSATNALRMRNLLTKYARKTSAPLDFVNWQGHDFSFRGMGGPEAAALSGAGHLVAFTGTDTIPAIELIRDYYTNNADFPTNYLIGGSVPATEHSVMCAGGKETERETISRLLDLYPSGILSVVSDTWNLWKVIYEVLPSLKEKILSRNGKLVIRPDSGDPVQIICGCPFALDIEARRGVVEGLWNLFGGTWNETGHRVLDEHIGVIYGDAINYERMSQILDQLDKKAFASNNIVFGVGSYTYQYVTRDVYGFAMKATWCQIDGKAYDLYKDPVTDSGEKKSAKGRLAVFYNDVGTRLVAINQATKHQEENCELGIVFEDGALLWYNSFDEIRKRAQNERDLASLANVVNASA